MFLSVLCSYIRFGKLYLCELGNTTVQTDKRRQEYEDK